MFKKEITLDSVKVFFEISGNVQEVEKNTFFFGFPLLPGRVDVKGKPAEDWIHLIKGYFLYLRIEKDSFFLANDITSGFRLYYLMAKSGIYFSDRYSGLINKAKEEDLTEVNRNEVIFLKKKGYTTGGKTVLKYLNKMKPASFLFWKDNRLGEKIYFKTVKQLPNRKKYAESVHNDIEESFDLLKRWKDPKILLFSGGVDSTLLALSLKNKRINFTPIFFLLKPCYRENLSDLSKCKSVAKHFNLDVRVLEIDWEFCDLERLNVFDWMLFDRHFSLGFFHVARAISAEFGKDTIVICGQSADSIFSYGPSTNSLRDVFNRSLFHFRWKFYSWVLNSLFFCCRMDRRFKKYEPRYLVDKRSYLYWFLNSLGYFPVSIKGPLEDFQKYYEDIIDFVTYFIRNTESATMYLKIYSHLQGSDNQVVINSFRNAGIHRILLPYATPQIIYNTLRFRNGKMDVFNPKYVVYDIIKNYFKAEMPKIKKDAKKDLSFEFTAGEVSQKAMNMFQERMKKMIY